MTKQIYLNILQKKNIYPKAEGGDLLTTSIPTLCFWMYSIYTKDNSVISESSSYSYLNRSKDLTISSSCIIPLKAR